MIYMAEYVLGIKLNNACIKNLNAAQVYLTYCTSILRCKCLKTQFNRLALHK